MKRILHLDIKPENFIEVFESHFFKRYFVFVGQFVIHYIISKVGGVVKLIDFGLAKKLPDGEDTLRSALIS